MAELTAAQIAANISTKLLARWSKNTPYVMDNLTALTTSIGEEVAAAITADTDASLLASTSVGEGATLVGVVDAAGIITAATVEAALAEVVGQLPMYARGVVFANVANLASFTVAGNDGLTYVEGQTVLLANQTTAAECGLYVVGAVAAGSAPLTRHPRFPAAGTWRNGQVVHVSEGTIFKGSTWKAMCTGTAVIGTNDPVFYPQVCKGTLTLASGTKTLGATEGLFLLSTTTSSVQLCFNTAGGVKTGTVDYGCAVGTRVAGKSGTAALVALAVIEAGTIQNQDNSTLDWLVVNW